MGAPLNIDWQQILLHLLNFAILAGGLYFLLYSPVKKFIAGREVRYAEREAEIQKTRDEAGQLKAAYEARMREAEQIIQREREGIHEELETERQHLLDEAREQARNIISTASQTAELRTRKAIEDARGEIRDMAIDMVRKLVTESGGDALDHFLDKVESERDDG